MVDQRLAKRQVSGAPVASRVRRPPARVPLEGMTVRLEPLDPDRHAADLYAVSHGDETARRVWTYLSYGPFTDLDEFTAWLRDRAASVDPLFFAVRNRQTGVASGMASYLNIHPEHGSIEIGHIWFGPVLQNTVQSTEALYLLMAHVFDDLHYRRLEWKCDALNEDSRRAALRLGFAFEGIFYRHWIIKGRNRDTAWFSLLEEEWPVIKANFQTWLAPANFDEHGRPRLSLRALNAAVRADAD